MLVSHRSVEDMLLPHASLQSKFDGNAAVFNFEIASKMLPCAGRLYRLNREDRVRSKKVKESQIPIQKQKLVVFFGESS